eukprot:Skav207226  [mRNA]  locus=scaffold1717:64936:66932:+ [translate_table: standard]
MFQLGLAFSEVNPLPFAVVRRVVEEELLGGLPLEEVFEVFEEKPLGSASIAQVHRAKLRTGREVAVKVQRPNVERRLMSDISAAWWQRGWPWPPMESHTQCPEM